VFERLFKERGLPANIRSDNGAPFASARALFNLSKLALCAWALVSSASNLAIRSKTAVMNDASHFEKRSHQTGGHKFLQQQARFDMFIEVFNNERPHEASHMKCPAEIYQPSLRTYQGLPDIDYPFHDQTIVETHCGRICLGKKKINSSKLFPGQSAGIKEVHDNLWLVSFMDYDLGYFDLESRVLEPLENPFGSKLLPMQPVQSVTKL
jgi:putative transposase